MVRIKFSNNQPRSYKKYIFFINPAFTLTSLLLIWDFGDEYKLNSIELKSIQKTATILSKPFCPNHFVQTILSKPFCPYHFVHTILSNTILSIPFCPIPFCPIPFCPYHFV